MKKLLLAVFAFFVLCIANAQAPSNDDCAAATTLTVNLDNNCTATTVAVIQGSTVSAEANSCQYTNTGDIWYQFTAIGSSHEISLLNFNAIANSGGNFNNYVSQPMYIALYKGTDCATLEQVGCSYNNVLLVKNLIPQQIYKVRVYTGSTALRADTSFEICVKTPLPAALCDISTINGDFELPLINSNFPNPYTPQSTVQGWRTTASDSYLEYWPATNLDGIPAYSGDQFAQLIAIAMGDLYQDFETPNPTEMLASFAHRGQQGTDICELVAGVPGAPDSDYQVILRATTSNTGWMVYSGTYTVPANQPITRFKFRRISNAGRNSNTGNFLDDINIRTNNGILSANPLALDCPVTTATVSAAGTGTWTIDGQNPSVTTIADVNAGSTTITGFGSPGIYTYYWTNQYCTYTLTVNYTTLTAAPVITDVEYCKDATAVALTATALTNHTLNWYTNAIGGTAVTAPVPDTATVGTTTYYVSQKSQDGCESDRVAITVTVNELPVANQPTNSTECRIDAANTAIFDITAKNIEILGTQTSANLIVSYYTTPENAANGTDAITGNLSQYNSVSAIIYARVENSTTGCFAVTSFTLTVNTGVTPPAALVLEGCSAVNLTDVLTQLGVESNTVTVTYYNNPTDADGQTNAITATDDFPITTDGHIVYVRITEISTGCVNVVPVTLSLLEGVTLPSDLTITACSPFDLNNAVSDIVGLTFTFYTNEDDALAKTNEIATPERYNLGSTTGIVYVRGENNSGCFAVADIILTSDCDIQRGLSPNGDTKNDRFDLTDLEVAKLTVLNRYGKEVYSQTNYTNQWEGQEKNGKNLPTGTYFYMIERKNGESKTGWVYINREE